MEYAKISTFVAGLAIAGAVTVMGLLGVSNTGCNIQDILGTNNPVITNVPPVPPVPPIPPVPTNTTTAWRGVMFVPASPNMPANNGVSSQLEYRGIHNKANENNIRIDMLQCVKNWGGNVLIYIRGEMCRPHEVLDMCLNGRKRPADGHYFPIQAPASGEVDWAMWAKQTYGISKHICFIWNDNTATPFTQAIVNEAVKAYDGTRLGLENVAFGVCLEADENMSADLVVAACGWIRAASPTSPVIVGSANEGFLTQIGSRVPYAILWLEQSSNPVRESQIVAPQTIRESRAVKAPLTPSTFPAYLASCKRLGDKFGYARVSPGEWWASSAADVASMTKQLQAAGFTFLGSGKYN